MVDDCYRSIILKQKQVGQGEAESIRRSFNNSFNSTEFQASIQKCHGVVGGDTKLGTVRLYDSVS